MTKIPVPFAVPDVSSLARHLRRSVQEAQDGPAPAHTWGHSTWLQTLAQAAGHRNHQTAKRVAETTVVGAESQASQAPSSELVLTPPANKPTHYLQARAAAKSEFAQEADVLRELAPDLSDAQRLAVWRALSYFDRKGRLLRWPAKRSIADQVIWPLWMRLDASARFTEGEITAILAQLNAFHDPVTLRRELINAKLVQREPNGAAYWRNADAQPTAEVQALMKAVAHRVAQG